MILIAYISKAFRYLIETLWKWDLEHILVISQLEWEERIKANYNQQNLFCEKKLKKLMVYGILKFCPDY